MTAVRKTQLLRFGVWASLATIAVIAALSAAYTEAGVRRVAGLFSTQPPLPDPTRIARVPAPAPAPPQVASRPFDPEVEARRLNEAVRILAADRDRLLARITVLERNLDDVTGSIPATPPAAQKAPPPLPQIPPQVAAPPPQPAPATQPPGRIATGHNAAIGTGSPMESVATKTEFGIDVGGATSTETMRAQWMALKNSQPGLFEGLRPVIAIREGRPGAVELRLVVGPLANAGAAARICAALSAANQPCQPAVFDGQRLALQ